MSGNRLINDVDLFEAFERVGHDLNLAVNSTNDLPKVIEALETWGQFEAAGGAKYWYEYLKIKINEEMNVRNAETA